MKISFVLTRAHLLLLSHAATFALGALVARLSMGV
jgi:hypothetical protein